MQIVLRQARSDDLKARKAKRREKVAELQMAMEDRAAARRFLQELIDIDRDARRRAATLIAKVKKEKSGRRTSDVRKRPITGKYMPGPNSVAQSSWMLDDKGMRGVHWQQSYIGKKSPAFYCGAARDRWLYEARDEAVLRDASGEPVIVTNLGSDIDEIGAAWQCIEVATTRKNGKIQIRIIAALDADASTGEQIAVLHHFCRSVLGPLGLPYSAVIHRPSPHGDQRNVHAHILTSFRPTDYVAPYT